jgi:hypothetical protein
MELNFFRYFYKKKGLSKAQFKVAKIPIYDIISVLKNNIDNILENLGLHKRFSLKTAP